ncbi:DUF6285 domain-containing protein [Pseudomonas sp. NPDC090202]|uniref:DUF6285 domain-containing protein n=1 Tax=unclassified Pseudomonas TaxID=196821 RepID=UPI003830B74E
MSSSNVCAIDLLDTAKGVLMTELFQDLGDKRRYEGRMVARAMSIAAREIDIGAQVATIEARALAAVLAHHGLLELTPVHARNLLAGFIRNGVYDADDSAREQLFAALLQITQARLSISNPKVIRDER